MEFKVTFANGRQTYVDADNEKELKSELDKLVKTFGSDISKVSAMDEKFSVGGFLTGSLLGAYFGNEIAKSGVKKTAKKVASSTQRTINKAKREVAGFRKASTRKYSTGGALRKGDVHEGREVFSEIGTYSTEAEAKLEVEKNNKFFTESNQPLIADVVSYSKKIGDRDVKVIKAVVFYKKEKMAQGGKITKQSDGSYSHPSGFKIVPYDKGQYILLDPEGMDAVGEYMTLTEAKQTLLDNVESGYFKRGGKAEPKYGKLNSNQIKDLKDYGYITIEGTIYYDWGIATSQNQFAQLEKKAYDQIDREIEKKISEANKNREVTSEEVFDFKKRYVHRWWAKVGRAYYLLINFGKSEFMAGGKTAKGEKVYQLPDEDYSYTNSFGIDQSDFEKMVDTFHNTNPLRQVSRIEQQLFWRRMAEKYGEEKTDEVGNYIYETHESNQKFMAGGKTAKGGVNAILSTGFYVKINPYYTATIRSLKSFEEYLKRKDEIWGKEFGEIAYRDKTASKEWVARLNELIAQKKAELHEHGSSKYKVGDMISILRNQAERDAEVIAVSGHEILVEYTMPNGTSALNVIDTTMDEYRGGSGKRNYEPITYSQIKKSKKWASKINPERLVNNPQSGAKYGTGGGVGKYEYKTINTRSASGLKEAERLKAEGWKIISTGFDTIQFERLKKNTMTKKHSRGGLTGSSAKVEFLSEEFASEELINELKEKTGITGNSTGDVPVIAFAFTDYGGDFIDKVAIEYFEENYPENIVSENTSYSGRNAFVFGDPAERWIEETENYPLGFDDFESYYYDKEYEAEMEGFEYFIDNELPTDEYVFDRDELLSWLSENKGGYYSVTTQGLDYSSSDLMDEVMASGLVAKFEDEEYGKGGYIGGLKEAEVLAKTIVYDNNGESYDRYTIFTPDGSVYGMSENASGFNQYIGDDSEIEKGSHLGKKLKSVPSGIKKAVLDRMKDEEFKNGGDVPKANLGMFLLASQMMQNRQARRSDPNYRSRWEDRGLDYRGQQPMMYPQPPMQPMMQPPMQPMGQPMYARGGSVGSEVTFNHWDGTTKTGTIVEIFPDGSMDVSCGFGHCLVNPSDVVGAEKMARGSKVSEYYGIKENNVITEKQMNLIKNRLNAGKKDAELEDIVQYIWDNAPDLTPDQNKKGHDFLMNLWKSPTGKERVNNPFGYREQEALEQFDHFSLAGFHDASRYGQAPYYIPLYDVWMKDGEYGFQYYYNGEVNIVGKKGMKVPLKEYRNNFSRMSKSELLDYCKKNNIPCASGWDKDQILDIINDVHASRYGKGGSTTGWKRDRMFVDKGAKHEVRYARSHAGRSGYKSNKFGGGGKTQENYDKLIGRIDREFYFLDYIFEHGDGFAGATGTIVVPVNKSYYEYATSHEGILERYMDAMTEDDWLETMGSSREDFEDEDEMIKAIEDHIWDQYQYGNLEVFEQPSSDIEDQMRELPEFSDSEEYPVFEIIGGGRIFDADREFDEIYNQELYDKIRKVEKFAKGGSTGWKRDRMFVDKGAKHEVRYARSTSGRSGYKDAKYGTGGGVGSSNPFVKVLLTYGFEQNEHNSMYFYHKRKKYIAVLDTANKKIELTPIEFLDADTFTEYSVDKLENFLVKKGFKKTKKYETGGSTDISEAEAKKLLEQMKSDKKITLSVGVHGQIFVQKLNAGNSFKKEYPNYLSAYKEVTRTEFGTGGSTGSKFYVVDNRELTFGSSKPVVASFDTREEARADAKDRNKIYDADTKMFSVMTAKQLKAEGVTEFGGGGSAGSKVINDLSREEAERLFALAHPKSKVGDRVWNNFKRTPVQLVYTQLEEKGIKYGKGGSTGKPVGFKSSNLHYNGHGVDANGNKVIRVSFPNSRAFSIQTNGNLPKTHAMSKGSYDEKEITQYVKEYGSDAQKKKLKIY